jgi:hypothetical protein
MHKCNIFESVQQTEALIQPKKVKSQPTLQLLRCNPPVSDARLSDETQYCTSIKRSGKEWSLMPQLTHEY